MLQPQNSIRDVSNISKGFPHSIDTGFTLVDPPNVFSVPQSAYSFALPSFVSGLQPNPNTDTYSVILFDVDICPVQPGVSRIRIDYLDPNGLPVVEYKDMPFYPREDNHPEEITEIQQLAEESIAFLQQEIKQLDVDILQVLNRMQTKGFSISGQINATQSTNTQPFSNPIMHSFNAPDNLNQKFIQAKEN